MNFQDHLAEAHRDLLDRFETDIVVYGQAACAIYPKTHWRLLDSKQEDDSLKTEFHKLCGDCGHCTAAHLKKILDITGKHSIIAANGESYCAVCIVSNAEAKACGQYV